MPVLRAWARGVEVAIAAEVIVRLEPDRKCCPQLATLLGLPAPARHAAPACRVVVLASRAGRAAFRVEGPLRFAEAYHPGDFVTYHDALPLHGSRLRRVTRIGGDVVVLLDPDQLVTAAKEARV